MIQSHEAKCRIDLVVDDGEIEFVTLGDSLPIGERRATERIDAQFLPAPSESGPGRLPRSDHRRRDRASRLHAWLEIEALRRRQSFSPAIIFAQQRVGSILNPVGDIGIGRAALRRIIFKATIRRRIVRRCDDDAVGQAGFFAAVMNQDRS